MGKKFFVILFAIVTIVMIFTGLEHIMFMTLYTNRFINIIGLKILYISGMRIDSFANYLSLFIFIAVSFIITKIIFIITKIVYVILKKIDSIELPGSGSGRTYTNNTDEVIRRNNEIRRYNEEMRDIFDKALHPGDFDILGNRKIFK